MKTLFLIGAAVLGLAAFGPASPAMAPAKFAAPPAPIASPASTPGRRASRRSAARPPAASRKPTSRETLDIANRAARATPAHSDFVDATCVYEYRPGEIFELYTRPGFVSTIVLEPGETLIDKAAGDTARWLVSETASGAGDAARTLVLVKPTGANLQTNIVLVTDRRAYLVEASSSAGAAYSAQIAWRYPQTAPPRMEAQAAAVPLDADRLNFGYRVRTMRGPTPRWTPDRVFDDGRRTWIEFPADIATSDMPPLFIITVEGAELVNYRVHGRRYEIDRLLDVAELRLGRERAIVVRIERQPVAPPRSHVQSGRP